VAELVGRVRGGEGGAPSLPQAEQQVLNAGVQGVLWICTHPHHVFQPPYVSTLFKEQLKSHLLQTPHPLSSDHGVVVAIVMMTLRSLAYKETYEENSKHNNTHEILESAKVHKSWGGGIVYV